MVHRPWEASTKRRDIGDGTMEVPTWFKLALWISACAVAVLCLRYKHPGNGFDEETKNTRKLFPGGYISIMCKMFTLWQKDEHGSTGTLYLGILFCVLVFAKNRQIKVGRFRRAIAISTKAQLDYFQYDKFPSKTPERIRIRSAGGDLF